MLAVVLVTGCGDAGALHAAATLHELSGSQIVVQPPPGGTLLGRAEDHGSSSSVTGRDAGVAAVFAVPGPVAAAAAYYQSAYPQFRLHQDCCASAQLVQLVGAAGPALPHGATVVGVDITTGTARIPDHYHPKLASAPQGSTTYVVVTITGQDNS